MTAYDLNGSVVDTFTVEHDNACRDGHSFVFDRLHKTLICSVCGEAAPANYTGWATDKTSGKQMYFLAGEYKTGWMLIGTTAYHFDLKNGTMHKTTILEDVPTTCSVQGHLSVKCECGETYETKYDKPSRPQLLQGRGRRRHGVLPLRPLRQDLDHGYAVRGCGRHRLVRGGRLLLLSE